MSDRKIIISTQESSIAKTDEEPAPTSQVPPNLVAPRIYLAAVTDAAKELVKKQLDQAVFYVLGTGHIFIIVTPQMTTSEKDALLELDILRQDVSNPIIIGIPVTTPTKPYIVPIEDYYILVNGNFKCSRRSNLQLQEYDALTRPTVSWPTASPTLGNKDGSGYYGQRDKTGKPPKGCAKRGNHARIENERNETIRELNRGNRFANVTGEEEAPYPRTSAAPIPSSAGQAGQPNSPGLTSSANPTANPFAPRLSRRARKRCRCRAEKKKKKTEENEKTVEDLDQDMVDYFKEMEGRMRIISTHRADGHSDCLIADAPRRNLIKRWRIIGRRT
ncbi:hypothetical protein GGR54DRAFT_644700 [Hypoxylon sp. NC1633]|nr:hypothetical protein GGR54DRAFT_644700 [Hypoxylon sp. NC1633]